ncbi:MAG: FAD-dependent oxidoreductase, partial [Rhodospirillaceae bacterium]|nr:FAD-dependent oxidoreductase [Rhodospirillaceae bacterium]
RGWHTETIAPKSSDDSVLVVGAGPAGLECARALGQRGYAVTLAEATRELGGRVMCESKLPGLSAWARVRDWRLGRLETMSNVEIFRESRLTARDVMDLAPDRVVLATGARWLPSLPDSADGNPPPVAQSLQVLTPDDIMAGIAPQGAVLVVDLDPYYIGGVIAEKLARDGLPVCLVTPSVAVSPWTAYTEEQHRIMVRLLEVGVDVVTSHNFVAAGSDGAVVESIYNAAARTVPCDALIIVSTRKPVDALHHELEQYADEVVAAGIRGIDIIGDARAPGAIVHAVASGHRFARELDSNDRSIRMEPAGVSFSSVAL